VDETKAEYDLARNVWVAALLQSGFDPNVPAFFLLEGLVTYFEKDQVEHLLGTIHDLVAPGSYLLVNTLHSSFLKKGSNGAEFAARMKERGAEWKFTSDDPATLIKSQGFNCLSCMSMRQMGDFLGPEAASRFQKSDHVDSYYFTLGQKLSTQSTIDQTD